VFVFSLLLGTAHATPQPQRDTQLPKKESSLASDARSVLGKVNFARAKELTEQLQKTLRNIKAYQRDIVSTEDPKRQKELGVMLDEEIGKAVDQTITILSFLQESGFEGVIYKHKEELTKDFTRESLPPYEKEIFLNAGFTETDFNEFVSLFASHGHEILVTLEKSGGVAGLKDRLGTRSARDKGKRASRLPAYMKIFAGAVGVVGDCTIGIIVGIALPPAAAVGVVASSAAGIAVAADGVKTLQEQDPPR
jgi:hypothetical protein